MPPTSPTRSPAIEPLEGVTFRRCQMVAPCRQESDPAIRGGRRQVCRRRRHCSCLPDRAAPNARGKSLLAQFENAAGVFVERRLRSNRNRMRPECRVVTSIGSPLPPRGSGVLQDLSQAHVKRAVFPGSVGLIASKLGDFLRSRLKREAANREAAAEVRPRGESGRRWR